MASSLSRGDGAWPRTSLAPLVVELSRPQRIGACRDAAALRGCRAMNAERLTARLDLVRKAGAGRWTARCPAHEDRGPSLSVRELDDGRVLIHCFAGCATADVVAAAGLSLSDLFPEREKFSPDSKPMRPNHYAREALRVLNVEALIVAIAAENVAQGVVLDAADRARVIEAANKIRRAVEVTK
jgi:hypothetical protein